MERRALGFNPVIPIAELTEIARKMETKGYESLWVHESLYQHDAISYLSAALGSTKTLKIGSGIINTVTRHPTLTAATFAGLADFSDGRVILGIGLGSFPTLPKIGVTVFPTSQSQPVKRIREYVTIVRGLLNGETVSFRGQFYTADNLKLDFKPKYAIPIYVAALFPKSIRATTTIASGAILSPALSTTKETAMKVKWISDKLSPGQEFDIASYILTSVSDEQEQASQAVRRFYFFVYQVAEVLPLSLLEPYGVTEEMMKPVKEAWKKGDVAEAGMKIPENVIHALTLTGTKEHCLESLQGYIKAGIKLPILMPIGDVGKALDCFAPKQN